MSDLSRPPLDPTVSYPELRAFGDALRLARERSGKFMGNVARELGWSVVNVSDMERGRLRPSEAEVYAFADAIGADPEPLLALLPTETRPNPFAPWLPMYAPGAVPERPWWRSVGLCRWGRVDGKVVTVHGPGTILLDALDAADAEASLPVPPPMSGQVWAWPNGVQVAIIAVLGDMPVMPEFRGATGAVTLGWTHDAAWPPPGAVLVAGPTPWGRDVPWAPPGWKP